VVLVGQEIAQVPESVWSCLCQEQNLVHPARRAVTIQAELTGLLLRQPYGKEPCVGPEFKSGDCAKQRIQ
jgi:hypothetical protein